MRNGNIIYHCRRSSPPNAEYETFDRPTPYQLRFAYLTIQPSTGNVYENPFGEFKDYSLKMCASPYAQWDSVIREGDRFYVNKKPLAIEQEPEYGWGYNADYKVVKVAKQNRSIFYALQSIVDDEYDEGD